MSRIVALNALDSGINRLRTKGGASPTTLYDLLNGWVTLSGTIQSRDGTVQDAALPADTKGLCAFAGELVVFSHEAQTVPSGYVCEILTHPTDPVQTLAWIHFAGPFVGYLYVVAEWTDGEVFHYWLRSADTWEADAIYFEGDLVQPTTPNGFIYKANRLTPAGVVWAASVARAVNDVVEPTVASGYKHTVVAALGVNPRSGLTEPTWATGEGGLTIEDADSATAPVVPPDVDPVIDFPAGAPERYENRYGIYDP